ncbi:MAG TPA: hypothetical protein VF120_04830, partial [Ktedonobacterales bacterium]
PDVLSAAAPVPLAVARPALYARLVELLREHGLSPTDLQADLRANPEGQTIMHAAFGSAFAQTMEWPLDADAHTAASDATEAALHQLADACERATQADYHARMRTPT